MTRHSGILYSLTRLFKPFFFFFATHSKKKTDWIKSKSEQHKTDFLTTDAFYLINLAHFFGPISVKIMDGVKLGNPGLISLHAFGAEGDAREYFIFHVKKQRQ